LIFIGIDPGKHGGIAVIDAGADVLALTAMPVLRGGSKSKVEYDVRRIFDRLVRQGEAFVWIERIRAMPPKYGGSAANYQRGYATGIFEALCVALKLRYEFVSPSIWQKAFWKGKGDTKQRAIQQAERIFPMAELLATERSIKPHDGMADALLIAEYGRRHTTGLLT
jgi:Holliday junction resolvasome RuvABC endonuclease subunit